MICPLINVITTFSLSSKLIVFAVWLNSSVGNSEKGFWLRNTSFSLRDSYSLVFRSLYLWEISSNSLALISSLFIFLLSSMWLNSFSIRCVSMLTVLSVCDDVIKSGFEIRELIKSCISINKSLSDFGMIL